MKTPVNFIVFLYFIFPVLGMAQASQPDTTGIQYGKTYELRLKAPVKCIQQIEYDKTGQEPKWKLSEDNQTIYIQDYIINTRVKLKVVYETGREEEYTQSSCTIRLSQSGPSL